MPSASETVSLGNRNFKRDEAAWAEHLVCETKSRSGRTRIEELQRRGQQLLRGSRIVRHSFFRIRLQRTAKRVDGPGRGIVTTMVFRQQEQNFAEIALGRWPQLLHPLTASSERV